MSTESFQWAEGRRREIISGTSEKKKKRAADNCTPLPWWCAHRLDGFFLGGGGGERSEKRAPRRKSTARTWARMHESPRDGIAAAADRGGHRRVARTGPAAIGRRGGLNGAREWRPRAAVTPVPPGTHGPRHTLANTHAHAHTHELTHVHTAAAAAAPRTSVVRVIVDRVCLNR